MDVGEFDVGLGGFERGKADWKVAPVHSEKVRRKMLNFCDEKKDRGT